MNKSILTFVVILILLFLGLGFLTALNYNSNNLNQNSDFNNQYNNQIQNNRDSALPTANPCGSGQYSYLCFKYQMLEQEKNEGYNKKPEQIRVEPCPAPKPVCPLCYKGIEQSKGEGNRNILEQTRVNC